MNKYNREKIKMSHLKYLEKLENTDYILKNLNYFKKINNQNRRTTARSKNRFKKINIKINNNNLKTPNFFNNQNYITGKDINNEVEFYSKIYIFCKMFFYSSLIFIITVFFLVYLLEGTDLGKGFFGEVTQMQFNYYYSTTKTLFYYAGYLSMIFYIYYLFQINIGKLEKEEKSYIYLGSYKSYFYKGLFAGAFILIIALFTDSIILNIFLKLYLFLIIFIFANSFFINIKNKFLIKKPYQDYYNPFELIDEENLIIKT